MGIAVWQRAQRRTDWDRIESLGVRVEHNVPLKLYNRPVNCDYLTFEADALDADGYREIARITSPLGLSVSNGTLTDERIKALCGAADLIALNIKNCTVHSRDLTGVSDQIGEFSVENCEIRDADWKQIFTRMPYLESVSLSASNIDDSAIVAMSVCKELRHVVLFDTDISDDGVRALAGLKNLQTLDVNGCNISDRGILCVAPRKGLRHAYVSGTRITDEGLLALLSCPDIAALAANDTMLTARVLPAIKRARRLSYVEAKRAGLTKAMVEEAGIRHDVRVE